MGVKRNLGYNLILTLCNYLFPLITFPYVSRVLHAENIGLCGIADSIINFFILFAMLGIGSYGVREIARSGSDKERRSEVFSNLLFINVFLTVIAVILLVLLTCTVESLYAYRDFLGIGLLKIVFNAFLIEWFFQGIEQFKYITVRTVAVNACYVLAVLLFVKNSDDTIVYYMLTTLVVVVNAIFNWLFSRKHSRFSFKKIAPSKYLKPVLSFGYYRILTSMYTTFNVLFLGFVSTELQAGYFVASTKLYTIIMAAFGAFTTVMIPRVSAMLASKEYAKLQNVANDTFSILVLVSVPIIMFSIFYAPEIISIVAGAGYEGAVLPFRIVIFLLLVIGMEQIVIQQFLMASSSNSSIMIVSTVGAVTGVAINALLTPAHGAVGSAIAWSVSEVCVLICGYRLMKKHVSVSIDIMRILKCMATCVPYLLLNTVLYLFTPASVGFWLALVLNVILFMAINLANRNSVISIYLLPVIDKFLNRKCVR